MVSNKQLTKLLSKLFHFLSLFDNLTKEILEITKVFDFLKKIVQRKLSKNHPLDIWLPGAK